MTLTLTQLGALSPLLIVAAGIVGLMLLIAAARHHRPIAQLTTGCLLLALAAAWFAPEAGAVTPLLMFDHAAHVLTVLMLGAGVAVTLLLYGYIAGYDGEREEIYLLLLLSLLGAVTLTAATHAASLLVGLELLSVSLFGLIAYPTKLRRPLEAGIKYLVLSAAASATLFFGFALLYAGTGSLSFDPIRAVAQEAGGQPAAVIAIGTAMVWVGLGFKLSLVPFHLWTADVYEGAPAPVTAYLATVSKGAVAALLLRYTASQPITGHLADALTAVAVATILLGNLLALQSSNVKRLLAYSAIAHFGYLLVPFIVGGAIAREAVLYYLVAYFVTTLGTFGAVTQMSAPMTDRDADHFWDYRGLFWRRPFITSILAPMALSLAGVPLTAGFLAKFYVLAAGVDARAWLLAAVIVLGSAIALFYYLRLVIVMFMLRPGGVRNETVISEIFVTGGIALGVLFVLLFWFGTFPSGLIAWLVPEAAAQ